MLSGRWRRAGGRLDSTFSSSVTPGRVHHAAYSHSSSARWPRPPENRLPIPPRELPFRPAFVPAVLLTTHVSYSRRARVRVSVPWSTFTPSCLRAPLPPPPVASRRDSSTARTPLRRPCWRVSSESSVWDIPLTTRVRLFPFDWMYAWILVADKELGLSVWSVWLEILVHLSK